MRESDCGLATLAVGSEAGFNRFIEGETIAAAMHLHALEDPEADANVAAVAGRNDLQDAVLVAFCRREQGFLLAPGNPLKIGTIDDVIAKRARIAMRPKGAGAQLLLLSLLHRAKAAARCARLPSARSARPVPISRRRSAPAAPIPASPRARSPIPPGSISCRSSGSRSIC